MQLVYSFTLFHGKEVVGGFFIIEDVNSMADVILKKHTWRSSFAGHSFFSNREYLHRSSIVEMKMVKQQLQTWSFDILTVTLYISCIADMKAATGHGVGEFMVSSMADQREADVKRLTLASFYR
ncbi:hypothetical protein Dimus_005357 [Dionaea muscipula]